MPLPTEIATLEVNGVNYQTWEAIEVSRAYGTTVSHARFRLAEIGDMKHGWASMRLRPGDAATVRLAGLLVLTGQITIRQVAISGTEHQVEIIIYSTTNYLQMTTPDHLLKSNGGQFKNQNAVEIINQVVAPWCSFVIHGNPPGAFVPFKRVSWNYGETCIQFAARLCTMHDIHLTDDESGNLVGGVAAAGPAGAMLEEGRNILRAHAVLAIPEGVSKATIVGQDSGDDQTDSDSARDVAAEADNPVFIDYRPRTMPAEQPGNQLDMALRAGHEVAILNGTMCTVNVTVRGWLRDDGSLWIIHVGEIVSIYAPSIFPGDSASLAIRGVVHAQDSEGGTTTTIDLCLPTALSMSNAPANLFPPGGGKSSATPSAPDTQTPAEQPPTQSPGGGSAIDYPDTAET